MHYLMIFQLNRCIIYLFWKLSSKSLATTKTKNDMTYKGGIIGILHLYCLILEATCIKQFKVNLHEIK